MYIWFLVQTKPNQEVVAKENLLNQGYKVYCPLFQIKGRFKPLFPGYLFIGIKDNSKNLSPIRSTRGISNFVRFGVEFAKVSTLIINSIKSQEQRILNMVIERSKPKMGDSVVITNGIFHGVKAVFEEKCGEERVILLLKVLQHEQRIQFDANHFKII